MGLELCVAHLADSLEPPPRQTVSEWADQNRRLSSEASAERGEALDCRVYAVAARQALISMGLSLDLEAERLETLAANVRSPAANRVARSWWMQE